VSLSYIGKPCLKKPSSGKREREKEGERENKKKKDPNSLS
jgi:hypothetical protein